jgi:hypothetical protein
MSTKEAIQAIKSMLFGDQEKQMALPVPAEAQKFQEYKLKNGAVVSIDSLEVGGSVTLEGNPAPDGEHELESGKKIETKGGLIVAVKDMVEVPKVEVEVEAMKKLPGMFAEMDNLKLVVENQAKTIANQQESLKQMFALVETIANNSIQAPKEAVKSFEEMTPLEKFRAQK